MRIAKGVANQIGGDCAMLVGSLVLYVTGPTLAKKPEISMRQNNSTASPLYVYIATAGGAVTYNCVFFVFLLFFILGKSGTCAVGHLPIISPTWATSFNKSFLSSTGSPRSQNNLGMLVTTLCYHLIKTLLNISNKLPFEDGKLLLLLPTCMLIKFPSSSSWSKHAFLSHHQSDSTSKYQAGKINEQVHHQVNINYMYSRNPL